jgi:hypothetical protein
MERYSVASAPRAAAVDEPSPTLKLVRTPTSKRAARKVVVESSGAEGNSTLEPLVEAWLKASNTKRIQMYALPCRLRTQFEVLEWC